MTDNLIQFIDDLKQSYTTYYDVTDATEEDTLPLAFRAEFHSRGESYFLVKTAKIWSNETNEFVYVFASDSFDTETVKKCVDFALEEALPKVKPHKEHQYSNVHSIFVAESIEDDVKKAITSQKYSKSYKWSLHGFSMLKTGYLSLSDKTYGTNKEGHDMAPFFKKLFV